MGSLTNEVAGLFLAMFVAGGCAGPRHHESETTRTQPAQRIVTIDLQTGFADSAVQLAVNGESLFSGRVTTDDRIGLAMSFEYDAGTAHQLELELRVEGQPPHRSRIDPDRQPYVGFHLDLDTGRIHREVTQEPFVYD